MSHSSLTSPKFIDTCPNCKCGSWGTQRNQSGLEEIYSMFKKVLLVKVIPTWAKRVQKKSEKNSFSLCHAMDKKQGKEDTKLHTWLIFCGKKNVQIIGKRSTDNNRPEISLVQCRPNQEIFHDFRIWMNMWLPCTFISPIFKCEWLLLLLCPYIVIPCWVHSESLEATTEKPSLHTILKHDILGSLSDTMIEWDIWECWELVCVFFYVRGT